MNVLYIILCFGSLFILGLIDNSRGPVYPEILKLYNITKSTGSIIFSMSSLMSFIMALTSKVWLKKLGAITATKLSILIHMIAIFMMGYVAQDGSNFIYFVMGCALFGVGVGIQSLSLNLIVANTIPLENRQKVFAGLHSMYGLASLCAPSLLSVVFHYDMSWQKYYMLLAILPLSLFLFSFKVSSQGIKQENTQQEKPPTKTAVKLGILFGFYVASEVLVSSRMVIYLKEIWDMQLDQASSYLGIFFFMLLAGRLLFTVIKVKYPLINLLKVSVFATIVFYLLGMYVNPLFLAITGGTMSFFFPCGMTWISHKYEKSSDAVMATVMTFVGGMIVSIHYVVGMISDIYGLQLSMMLGVFMLLVVLYFLQTEK